MNLEEFGDKKFLWKFLCSVYFADDVLPNDSATRKGSKRLVLGSKADSWDRWPYQLAKSWRRVLNSAGLQVPAQRQWCSLCTAHPGASPSAPHLFTVTLFTPFGASLSVTLMRGREEAEIERREKGSGNNCSFRVGTAKLQHRFQQLQHLVHPDFFSQRSQTEKDFSEKHSILVNDAYNTLLATLSRGLYCKLKLHGIEIPEGTDYEMDSQFLMKIMEINEKLAEAQSEAAMKEIESTVQAKQKECTDNESRAFEQDDFEKAKEILTKMKYFSNVEEKIKLKMTPSS
ncbi:iron-sulfur cluster co-chaperone protein HscB-like [Marmota marmota marmota]|uniref:iron-sulfur cluster co-chaperone protein HscB-like n=1 Tax=Marmota marmota marmota TaxID=9994 RepID=UPI0020930F3F|nr:iron-sulfur cluster co-chaperone protein HscB-like [Marmota marmota marmota]